ncbi:MAG: hypothetical protein NVS3B21_35490 [Acidimicrobiales bacterium]
MLIRARNAGSELLGRSLVGGSAPTSMVVVVGGTVDVVVELVVDVVDVEVTSRLVVTCGTTFGVR